MNFLNIRPDIKNLQLIAFGFIVLWGLSSNPVFLAGYSLFFALIGYAVAQEIRVTRELGATLNPITSFLNILWSLFSQIHVVVLLLAIWIVTQGSEMKDVWLQSAFNMSIGIGNSAQLNRPENYFSPDSMLSPFVHLWAMSVAIQFIAVLIAVGFLISLVKIDLPVLVKRVLVLALVGVAGYIVFSNPVLLSTEYFLTSTSWTSAVLIGLALGFTNIRLPESKANSIAGDLVFFAVLVILILEVFGFALIGTLGFILITLLLAVPVLLSRNETLNFRVLSSGIVSKVSYLSIGSFLWHWPLAQIAKDILGVELLSSVQIIAVVVLSVVLGFITVQLVDYIGGKLSNLGGLRQWTTKIATLAVVPLALFFLQSPITNNVTPDPTETVTFTPALDAVAEDVPDYLNNPDCTKNSKKCLYGDLKSDTHVILYGNSLSGNWQPALAKIAEEEKWKLEVRINPDCPSEEPDKKCDTWLKLTATYILAEKPDLVVSNFGLIGTARIPQPSGGTAPASIRELFNKEASNWMTFMESGIRVVTLRGPGYFPKDPIQCLRTQLRFLEECTFSKSSSYVEVQNLDRYMNQLRQKFNIIDVIDEFCKDELCPVATPDGRVIYRTSTEITKTFSLSVSSVIQSQLKLILATPLVTRPSDCLPNDPRPEC